MEYEIFTFDNRSATPLVARSLGLFGARCQVLGQGLRPWRFSLKIDLALEALEKSDCRVALVCDAYDVLFLAHPREAIERFLAFECPMLLNADKRLWPRLTEQDHRFGELYRSISDSPFRYLNSGCYVGYRDFLVNFLKKVKESPDHPRFPGDDQYMFHFAFAALQETGIRMDTQCKIFQVFNRVDSREVERIGLTGVRNKVFDSRPIVLHANKLGRTKLFPDIKASILAT